MILNPASSGGRGRRVAERLQALLEARGLEHTWHETSGPGHAQELARASAESGVDRILAVGGDGTVHEVANGMLQADPVPTLAVIPVGTGNDFYRMVGASRELGRAVEALDDGVVRRFDVGRADWDGHARYFVNLLGLGVDVEVLRRRARFTRLSGLPQYLAALVSAVVRYQAVPVRLTLDSDEVIDDRTMIAAITVGPSAGGGFLLCPSASPDDGLLDLCFVDRLNHLQVARYIPRVIRGTHASLPVVRLRRFRRARIEAPGDEPFHFQLDGELVPAATREVQIRVEAGRLPVLVQA